MVGEGRRDLRGYKGGAGKLSKTHRTRGSGPAKPPGGGCAIIALVLLSPPALGIWGLIERLVS